MRIFKHNSGAHVYVDHSGKKKIYKYGIEFKTFTELKHYEKRRDHQSRTFDGSIQVLKQTYRDYKQK